jgi:hypothetical protein
MQLSCRHSAAAPTMSATTVVEAYPAPLNLTLGNGQKIYFHSDESIEADEIPVIDISGIYSDNIEERRAVAEQIREACHRIGFFYIINHGIHQKYAESTFQQAKRFFALSEEQKMEVCTDLVPEEFFGYFPMSTYNRNHKKKKDLMEAYNWWVVSVCCDGNTLMDLGAIIQSTIPRLRAR